MVCSLNICEPARRYVEFNFERSDSFIRSEVLARGAYLALAPVDAAIGLADLALGTIAGVGAVLSLGMSQSASRFAVKNLFFGGVFCLSEPYYIVLQAISPGNQCEARRSVMRHESTGLALPVFTRCQREFYHLRDSDESATLSAALKREVGSRLVCLAGIVTTVVARILETGAGLIFLPLSLLCLG
ncbi:MAG: hypothetical protein HYZ48_00240, partial [Chlamydiales bacterium]|nr:hypothetical protein [Chlamydiales bacterium]